MRILFGVEASIAYGKNPVIAMCAIGLERVRDDYPDHIGRCAIQVRK